jgi:hypothetical protein
VSVEEIITLECKVSKEAKFNQFAEVVGPNFISPVTSVFYGCPGFFYFSDDFKKILSL